MKMFVAWGINKRKWSCAHACRALISVALQRHSGVASMIGALKWKDTGFLGKTGRVDKEGGITLDVSEQLECMELHLRAYESR